MAKNRYLRRKDFDVWLESQEDFCVGRTRSAQSCPIATYLVDVTARLWNVSTLNCVPQVNTEPGEDPDRLNHEFKPPRWARDFMNALDHQFGRKSRDVTGVEALSVLREAVR